MYNRNNTLWSVVAILCLPTLALAKSSAWNGPLSLTNTSVMTLQVVVLPSGKTWIWDMCRDLVIPSGTTAIIDCPGKTVGGFRVERIIANKRGLTADNHPLWVKADDFGQQNHLTVKVKPWWQLYRLYVE